MEIDLEKVSNALKCSLLKLRPAEPQGKRKLSKIYEKNVFQHVQHMKRCLESSKILPSEEISKSDGVKLKSDVVNAVVQYVSQDMRPYTTIAGKGFFKLANALIQTGNKYGNMKAEDIIPHPTTISKYTNIVCAKKEKELRDILRKISKQGDAITTDIWTDDFKKK